jgi:hypothetical protein
MLDTGIKAPLIQWKRMYGLKPVPFQTKRPLTSDPLYGEYDVRPRNKPGSAISQVLRVQIPKKQILRYAQDDKTYEAQDDKNI